MGCTSSKQQMMESESPQSSCKTKLVSFTKPKSFEKDMCPPSVKVEALWVKGHGVFAFEKEGNGEYAEQRT
ncbi:hypothetical protein PILCRDRAFT_813934 [Piloderma croceum F 1598]|uniref:Uncharacterized protein n=1 Tax=Piloderma croceum (strain F 1598) TaxID=765440 RepID=A0A0C3CGP7_PILCF|nr:hypothetical protein PILCRDRAFT_813934 [Piloderma croceum F 1598]